MSDPRAQQVDRAPADPPDHPAAAGSGAVPGDPGSIERVRPIIRVRQVREFTAEPVSPADLEAIADVARWSGSSRNEQPWRFISVSDVESIRRLASAGLPQTRSLQTATAAIAIAMPDEPPHAVSRAFDEGRAAERMLIGAYLLGLSAGIAWIRPDVLPAVRDELRLPAGWFIRTVVSLGHPTEAARRPKSPPGQARRPRAEVVFEGTWPEEC